MSGFAQQSAARARGLATSKIAEAEKLQKSWFKTNKNEDAAQLYKEAGHQFKAAKDLQDAGESYVKAAQYFQRADMLGEAAMSFSDAATVLKEVDASEAISAARQAISIYQGQGRFSQAGRLTTLIAEVYEASGDEQQAMENYQEAYEICIADNQPQKAHKWLHKVGDLAVKAAQYQKAGEVFETMADFCLSETRLQQANAKNLYTRAWLCYMVYDSLFGSQKGQEFLEKDYNLAESREGELIREINGAVEAMDEAQFTVAVNVYNEVSRLSPEFISLLLKIREPIEAAAEAAEQDKGAEEDLPDLDAVKIDVADDVLPVNEEGEVDLT
uniref:Uncharacterized protein n=1 Tax=Pinguiococcus pyrenoidosus TaxID=172671 RepID=A0A7R9YE68_9STRA